MKLSNTLFAAATLSCALTVSVAAKEKDPYPRKWVSCYGGDGERIVSVINEYVPIWASDKRIVKDFTKYITKEGYKLDHIKCFAFDTIDKASDFGLEFMIANPDREVYLHNTDTTNGWFYTTNGVPWKDAEFILHGK